MKRLRAFAAERCVVCKVYAQWQAEDGTAYCTAHKPEVQSLCAPEGPGAERDNNAQAENAS